VYRTTSNTFLCIQFFGQRLQISALNGLSVDDIAALEQSPQTGRTLAPLGHNIPDFVGETDDAVSDFAHRLQPVSYENSAMVVSSPFQVARASSQSSASLSIKSMTLEDLIPSGDLVTIFPRYTVEAYTVDKVITC
jgi:hypothetical protein